MHPICIIIKTRFSCTPAFTPLCAQLFTPSCTQPVTPPHVSHGAPDSCLELINSEDGASSLRLTFYFVCSLPPSRHTTLSTQLFTPVHSHLSIHTSSGAGRWALDAFLDLIHSEDVHSPPFTAPDARDGAPAVCSYVSQ